MKKTSVPPLSDLKKTNTMYKKKAAYGARGSHQECSDQCSISSPSDDTKRTQDGSMEFYYLYCGEISLFLMLNNFEIST